jgi:hypothetical protein
MDYNKSITMHDNPFDKNTPDELDLLMDVHKQPEQVKVRQRHHFTEKERLLEDIQNAIDGNTSQEEISGSETIDLEHELEKKFGSSQEDEEINCGQWWSGFDENSPYQCSKNDQENTESEIIDDINEPGKNIESSMRDEEVNCEQHVHKDFSFSYPGKNPVFWRYDNEILNSQEINNDTTHSGITSVILSGISHTFIMYQHEQENISFDIGESKITLALSFCVSFVDPELVKPILIFMKQGGQEISEIRIRISLREATADDPNKYNSVLLLRDIRLSDKNQKRQFKLDLCKRTNRNILCIIEVSRMVYSTEDRPSYRLYKNTGVLQRMFDNSAYTDACIIIPVSNGNDIEIPVHRAVLAACSPVFDKMFSSPMRESNSGVIIIEDTTPIAVRVLVFHSYNYPYEAPLTASDLWNAFKLAEKYDVRDLKLILCSRLLTIDYEINDMVNLVKKAYVYGIEARDIADAALTRLSRYALIMSKRNSQWKPFMFEFKEDELWIEFFAKCNELQKECKIENVDPNENIHKRKSSEIDNSDEEYDGLVFSLKKKRKEPSQTDDKKNFLATYYNI